MRKIKYLSGIIFCLLGVAILTSCNVNNNETLQIIDMGPGDISLASTLEDLVTTTTHIMRVEVLDSHVIREENPIPMPREARIESFIARHVDDQEMLDRIDYIFPLREDGWTPMILPRVMTIYRVQVLEIFRELEVFHDTQVEVGEIIEVLRPGGLYGNEYWDFEGATLDMGAGYVLFLNRHWEYSYRFYVDAILGVYYVPDEIIEDNDLVKYDDITLELESAGWSTNFDVTIEDLIELSEEDESLEVEDDGEPEDVGDVYGDGIDDEENDAKIEKIEDSDE